VVNPQFLLCYLFLSGSRVPCPSFQCVCLFVLYLVLLDFFVLFMLCSGCFSSSRYFDVNYLFPFVWQRFFASLSLPQPQSTGFPAGGWWMLVAVSQQSSIAMIPAYCTYVLQYAGFHFKLVRVRALQTFCRRWTVAALNG
jgi:hypothetical protein